MSTPKPPSPKPDQPVSQKATSSSQLAAPPTARGAALSSASSVKASELSQGSQEALAGPGTAKVTTPPLSASDPAHAIATAWKDNAAYPSIAAKGRALIDAGLDTKVCHLGWCDRGETRDRLGQEAAFYAFVGAYGSPASKREIAIDLVKDWLADKYHWHSDQGPLHLAINVKARTFDTQPEQKATLSKLGVTSDQAWERVLENVWEGWRNDWHEILLNSGCDPSKSHPGVGILAEGRSNGWAVPTLNDRAFEYEGFEGDLETLRDTEEPDENAIRGLEHVFALAQFDRLLDEILVDPQAAWNSEIQAIIESETEEVRESEPELIREHSLLKPLALDPDLGNSGYKDRLDAIRNKLEAAFGVEATKVKLDPTLPTVTCPHCDGTSEEPGAPVDLEDGIALCNLCEGTGVVTEAAAKAYSEGNDEEED